jgi:Flp pilus assembly protein TadD
MELLSYISGFVYYYSVLYLVKVLFSDYQNRVFAFIALVFSGTAVLFCGYAETYTLLPALLALFFATSFRYLEGKVKIYWSLGLYLLLILFHFMFLFLIPCVLLVAYFAWRGSKKVDSVAAVLGIAASIAVLVIVPRLAFLPTQDVGGLVLDLTGATDTYWLLSGQHLLDILDQLLLCAIAGIIIFAGLIPQVSWAQVKKDHRLLFVLASVPGAVALLVLLRSILGYASDWDLFSSAGLVIVVAAVSLFAFTKVAISKLAQVLLAAAAIASFLSFAAVNANYNAAIARQIDILTLAGDNGAVGFETMGNDLNQLGNKDLAEQMWKRSARLKPHWRVYTNLGQIKLNQGKMEEAEAYLRKAWDLDSTKGVIATDLGMAVSSLGKVPEGEYFLRKAVELDPGEGGYQQNLAICLAMQKRFGESEVYFRNALKLRPNDPDCLTGLGGILMRQHKFEEGEAVLKQAINLSPTHSEPYVNLAFLYQDSGRKEQGAQVLQLFLSRYPNARDFTHIQQLLEEYQKEKR